MPPPPDSVSLPPRPIGYRRRLARKVDVAFAGARCGGEAVVFVIAAWRLPSPCACGIVVALAMMALSCSPKLTVEVHRGSDARVVWLLRLIDGGVGRP